MKKILVLLLMLTSFYTVSCGGGGEQGILGSGGNDVSSSGGNDVSGLEGKDKYEDVRNVLIFHPDETLVGQDVTDLREHRKDIPVFGKFMDALSDAGPDENSGWVTYRWEDGSETDCDGGYKLSYLERVADNRFVGGGMCLLDTGFGNRHNLFKPNDTGDRFVNLWKLVNTVTNDVNNLYWSYSEENIPRLCNRYRNSNMGHTETLPNISNESGELYMFLGELEDSSTDGSVSVDVKCHPDGTLIGTSPQLIYEFTDDTKREFREEAVDELNSLNSRAERDEGVWNAYTFPKPGQRSTLSDPPKVSYFRIAEAYGRQYVVGAGIYLDENNPNVDPENLTRLEKIRNRVREAADILRGKEGEELLDALEDNRDYFTNDDNPDSYIFVWENRPE